VDSPTRIAFCITDLDPGGAERALVHLVTRLDRTRWEPAVFCLSGPGALVEPLERARVPVTCFGARGKRDWKVLFRLRRELKNFRPQILQTFLFHANFLGRIAAALAGVPHCVSGIRVAERRSRWPLWLDRLTNRLVDTNVCVSRAVADFSASEAGLATSKLEVIPNGVDVDAFAGAAPVERSSLGLPAEARIVLSVGRLDPQKGLTYLIDAAVGLASRFPDVHFVFVGNGPQRRELEGRVASLKLTGRMHFLGWRPDVPGILTLATCLVLPSLWEGMPNVVLEAMAAGLPVVATRVEGVAELVVPGETGILVAARSASELTEGLSQVLSAPERARQMGAAGQERVKALFSWEKMTELYDALYRRLLS